MEQRVERIISFVAQESGVGINALYSHNRKNDVVDARHVLFYVFHHLLGMSSTKAGAVLFFDHASVLYANKRIMDWREHNNINRRGLKLLEDTIKFIEENGLKHC